MWLLSNKVRVADSGLFDGFCDCHTHLLPGVDDGVQKVEESLQILEEWEHLGVKDVWLTPHVMEDFPNTPADLNNRFESFRSAYRGNIALHLAAENMLDGLFQQRLETGHLLTYEGEGNGRRLLVETSYYIPPMNMELLVHRIKDRGYELLLAHPERYQYMDFGDYKKWKEKGVRLQLNVPSLVGAYGPQAQQKARRLLSHGMYDCCGTDTHALRHVRYFLDAMLSKKTVKAVRSLITTS